MAQTPLESAPAPGPSPAAWEREEAGRPRSRVHPSPQHWGEGPGVGGITEGSGGEGRPPRIFFDVDGTLITWNRRLRPYAREVIAALHARGFEIYIWSGVGLRWEVVAVHELTPFILDCYHKPLSKHHARLPELGVPFVPDHVVDDDDEIVAAFGGTHVPEPLEPLSADRHLLRVLADVQQRFRLEPGFDLLERNWHE